MEVKTNINKWDLIKFKSFCIAKTINKVNRQPSKRETIIANETTDERINFQNIQAAHTTQYQKNNPNKKQEKDLNRHFSKEDIPMANKHVKRSSTSLIIQFSSVTQLCPTLCDPMNHSTPGLPVQHQLPEFTQSHVHWVGDAIQPSHPLSSPSPPALNLSQHQGLFKWVSSSYQVAKVLEFQLQHQSFQ